MHIQCLVWFLFREGTYMMVHFGPDADKDYPDSDKDYPDYDTTPSSEICDTT